MRRTLLAATVGCTLIAIVGCTDDAVGPRRPVAGRLAVVPNFGALQGGIVDVARGRFVLTRIPSGAVAKDTVLDIPAGADSVDLSLSVPVLTPGETFNLTITLISPAGDTVFRGGPLVVMPGTSGTPVPVNVPFAYVGTGANAAGVRILSPDTSTFTGEPVLLTAEAFGGDALAIPGTPIGWTSLDTGRVSVTTDAQDRGVAVGGPQRGVARLVATLVTGQKDTVQVSNQPLPTAIVADSGAGQSALADSTLAQPLVARVTAGDGLGVSGLWVRFAVTSGAGVLSADSVLTDAQGRARVSFTVARSFQPHVVTATTPRLAPPVSAIFAATLLFPPPATLEIAEGNTQTATAGAATGVAPKVRALDADGLPIPGVTVTFAVTAGGGIVAGGTPVTDTLGEAAVTSWTLGTAAGANTLTATIGALSVVFTATGTAAPAAAIIAESGGGQSGTVGTLLPAPIVARLEDTFGNGVPGLWVRFVVTAGGGSVALDSVLTDATGRAGTAWTVGTVTGAQQVAATTAVLPAASALFTATALPGAPTVLAFTVEPSDVLQNAAITPAIQVAAFDQYANVATQFTGNVIVAILNNPGDGTLAGTTTVAAVLGVATFADLSINLPGPGYTLLAEDTGLEADTSVAFNVTSAGGGPGINTWIAPSGVWSDPSRWTLGRAPIADDTVQITQGLDYQVTLDVDASVAKLTIGGTGDIITLDVGDRSLTITDAGADPGLDILPLGALLVGSGNILVERISNQGSVRFAGTTATLGTGVVVNSADFRVVGGQLSIIGEGVFDFQTSGLFRLENNAAVIFDTGLLTYLGGTIEAGLGTGNVLALIDGSELSLRANLALDSVVVALADARIQAFNGSERLSIGPDAGITMDGTTLAEVTAVVENEGVITASTGVANYLNDSLYNAATGVVAVNASGAAVALAIAGTENVGTVSLLGAQAATLSVAGLGGQLTNRPGGSLITAGTGSHVFTGILINESGADVILGSPLTINRPTAANHVNGGTIDVAGGDLRIELNVSGASFTNQGTMNVSGGNVMVTMAGTSPTFVNEGTLTVETPRSFTVANASNGAFTNAATGILQGAGTFSLTSGSPTVSNLGTIAPGLSPGVLTWQGGLPMGATSNIAIELGGTTVGTGYDQLDASGFQLGLGGQLNVTLISGFQPAAGDSFAILTGTRTGSFTAVNLPAPPQGIVLDTGSTTTTYYVIARAQVASVLFAGDSAGNAVNSGIFRVDPDGSNQFHITSEGPPGETNVHPRWAPDRTRVTYSARALRADPNQLHIRSADGVDVSHLTSTSDTSTFRPRYSPDGVHLAFECGDGGFPNTPQDVCVIADVRNPADGMGDGTGKVYVTDAADVNLGGSGAFAWNPQNAEQLAVVRDSAFQGPTVTFGSLIWLVNFDGSGATPLGDKVLLDGAGAPMQVVAMDWSPDGSFIAFEGLSGGISSIYRIEVATGAVTQLTSQFPDHRPVVSPDGSEILFGRENDLWVLYKVSSTGAVLTQLSPNMNFGIAQAGWDWSPDGSEIVVTEDVTTSGVVISKVPRDTDATSFLSDANAGKLGRRGGVEIQDRQPSWRP